MKRLRFLEEAQWLDPGRLQSHQNRALSALIRVAYQEVPFYRELMDKARVKPEEIRTARDLHKLPIVTKTMLRSAYPHLTTRNTGWRTYEAHTSGSTGTNFCVMEDTETRGWYRASFLLALQWAGWRIGEPHLQMGMSLNRSLEKRLKDALLRCYYTSAFDLTDSALDRALELMERHSIQHLWGYPGSIYFLARRAIQRGWNQPLRSVVTWGDNLLPHYRKIIERAFGTRVFDTYGCAEGIQVAAQCGQGSTYHVHSLDVIVEYLDDDGLPVSPGEPGNLILTRLHPGPMPLIRYRVGDIGISGGVRNCKCGRGFEVMEAVLGRDTDVVLTPSGNRLIVHFFTGILEHFPEIDSFQVVQEELDSIVLRIVPSEKFSEEVAERVIQELKQKGAADMKIEVELVEAIPVPPSGKRRFLISKIKWPG